MKFKGYTKYWYGLKPQPKVIVPCDGKFHTVTQQRKNGIETISIDGVVKR